MTTNEMTEFFGEVISSYSRAQAIEDGVLVELPPDMQGKGFPIALTSAVHGLCTPPKGSNNDYKGRVWDVLTMFRFASKRGGSLVLFKVKIGRKLHTLKALCGPGDDAEPVITIMLPEED